MVLVSSEPIEHLDEFHDRQKTDTNPQARMSANVGENVNKLHRRLLSEVLYQQRLAYHIHANEIVPYFRLPVRCPVRRPRHALTLDKILDSLRIGDRRCCDRRRCDHEVHRRAGLLAIRAELVPNRGITRQLGRCSRIAPINDIAQRGLDDSIRIGQHNRTSRPLVRADAATPLITEQQKVAQAFSKSSTDTHMYACLQRM